MGEVMITRLSSKGQIVLPKALRETLGLKSGEIFAMFGEDDTIVLKKIELPSEKEFEKLLKWGQKYAKRFKISKKDVLRAIEEIRGKGG
ncbi:MAG: AbrB/MazE/SpoVT family DNA-binding domain-containing protein [Thermoplasmata archaeon]